MNMFSLEGKNAVVIGGAGGLGQAIAQGLAEAGASVVIASRREESLKRAVGEIQSACGKTVTYHTVDASNEESVASLVEKVVAEKKQVHRASTRSSPLRTSTWTASGRCWTSISPA